MRILDFEYSEFLFMLILLAGVVVDAHDQLNSREWNDSPIAIRQKLEVRLKRETEDGNDSFVVKYLIVKLIFTLIHDNKF